MDSARSPEPRNHYPPKYNQSSERDSNAVETMKMSKGSGFASNTRQSMVSKHQKEINRVYMNQHSAGDFSNRLHPLSKNSSSMPNISRNESETQKSAELASAKKSGIGLNPLQN